jgi:Icc-related predicted phosphoesterase
VSRSLKNSSKNPSVTPFAWNTALAKLQTERRVAVLHYSPIRATLHGEDPGIFAFLWSSRLEEPINRFRVRAVFHGHAHNGILDGKTSTDIPVYNVSAPALR